MCIYIYIYTSIFHYLFSLSPNCFLSVCSSQFFISISLLIYIYIYIYSCLLSNCSILLSSFSSDMMWHSCPCQCRFPIVPPSSLRDVQSFIYHNSSPCVHSLSVTHFSVFLFWFCIIFSTTFFDILPHCHYLNNLFRLFSVFCPLLSLSISPHLFSFSFIF